MKTHSLTGNNATKNFIIPTVSNKMNSKNKTL